MSSNNDHVIVPMTQRSTSVPSGTSTSDLKTCTEGAVLSFRNLSYREKWQTGFPLRRKTFEREILSNANGIMNPGLNAIMDPQDGSRSLLLDVLAARKDPRGLSGEILINGAPQPANFRCNSGYVPQIDMVVDTVNVRENVEFSAALRLPMTVTSDERRRRINEVLKLLGLDKVENSKPISKEDRKRTAIAMELITDHRILFLDEPTTGLDSSTAHDVILLLQWMSKQGRTIIFSINRPQLFDSLTLVAKGKVLFHGPAQDALEYFKLAGYHHEPYNNPADFFLDVINGDSSAVILGEEEEDHEDNEHKELFKRENQVTEKLAEFYAQSSLYNNTRGALDQLSGEQRVQSVSAFQEITCVTSFWHQLRWIIWRSFKVMLAMVVGNIFRVLRNDCIEVQSRASLLYVLTFFQCITSVLGARFVMEAKRFLHEHTSGYYRELPYFFGKLVSELVPRRLFPSILFTIISYSIAGVKGSFTMVFTVLMLDYSASSLTLSVGTGENALTVPTLIVDLYFRFMLVSINSAFLRGKFSFNYFLWKMFELNGTEISHCQNYVICTGEEFLTIQDIDLSSWGFWKNHVALAIIMIIFLQLPMYNYFSRKN
uniref:ABC transporter domain-containing protein n=1 Tax=Nannospalax galili TaxID=1026970 RepID=A0A8C6R1U7_NANGA